VDRHYNHGDGNYPLAHNPVTSHYVSGPVRFPVDLRLYRRYEEVTRWEEFVHKHFPKREIPTGKKERTEFHKEVDPVLLQDAEFQVLHQQFQTKIALAKELVVAAIRRKLPFGVVLFDSWYLAEEFIACLRRRRKDWISILKKNRNLETYSFMLKDADGKRIPLAGPHISIEDLVPLIPPNAYRAVQVGDQTYWTFTLPVRIPGLGKVRLVISFGVDPVWWTVVGLGKGAQKCPRVIHPICRSIANRFWNWRELDGVRKSCRRNLSLLRSASGIGSSRMKWTVDNARMV
jgi:hypothetical protein